MTTVSNPVLYADADLPNLMIAGMPETSAEARRIFAEARSRSPIARGLFGPTVVGHAEVTELLRDKRLRGPGMDFARMSGIPEGGRLWRRTEQILLFMEGDDHTRLRRLVSKAFTPKAVESLRPIARATFRDLVDSVDEAGSCEAVATLCNPFPIPVICALIGIEPDRIDDMSRWAGSILQSLRLDAFNFLDEIEQALAEIDEYIETLITQRRANPRDDLLSNLIAVEDEGDRLSASELLAVVEMMLVAGTDTTRNQLSCMINTFCEHPGQWALLRSRPELIGNAVEEAIRWDPATAAIPRFALEDIEIGGVTVPAGNLLVLLSMSANHDDAVLPGADRFDITRQTPGGWHLLTFGGGIHYCLGASLARLELTEALAEMVDRFPTLALTEPAVTHPAGSPIFGYSKLALSWAAAD